MKSLAANNVFGNSWLALLGHMCCVMLVMQARAYEVIQAVAYNDYQHVHAVTETCQVC